MTNLRLLPFVFALVTAVNAFPQPVFSIEAEEIKPPHVFSRIQQVLGELELLRYEMGKPKTEQLGIRVTGAAPREVYFQALTLFRKANRLSFEKARQKIEEPPSPSGEITPAVVIKVVGLALERIRLVKKKLRITETVDFSPVDETRKPSHVFLAIVHANRQINLLLDIQFSPSEVFQQVTQAVAFTSRLLERWSPEVARFTPDPPPFERGKTPSDVYHRLTVCMELIGKITHRLKIKIIHLDTKQISMERVTPSDVYDLASLVVSELSHLHSLLKDSKPVHLAYYPGFKLPSDVFQRVGILEAQLSELHKAILLNNENFFH